MLPHPVEKKNLKITKKPVVARNDSLKYSSQSFVVQPINPCKQQFPFLHFRFLRHWVFRKATVRSCENIFIFQKLKKRKFAVRCSKNSCRIWSITLTLSTFISARRRKYFLRVSYLEIISVLLKTPIPSLEVIIIIIIFFFKFFILFYITI